MEPANNSTDSEPIIADVPLWKSFWVGQFRVAVLGIVILILLNFSRGARNLNMSDNVAEIVGWAFFVPIYLLIMLSVWKCAYNTRYAILGHLARAYAVLTSLLFIAIIITAIFD